MSHEEKHYLDKMAVEAGNIGYWREMLMKHKSLDGFKAAKCSCGSSDLEVFYTEDDLSLKMNRARIVALRCRKCGAVHKFTEIW